MKTFSFLILLLLLSTSCGTPVKKYLEKGEVVSNNFYEEIDFEFSNNLIFLNVEINGKLRRFMLDSGAPNIISRALFEEMGLKPAFSDEVRDSQENSRKQDFALIPSIKIGSLEFTNTLAVVIEDYKSPEIKCLGFDGLIGANLMRKALWQIDYQREKIIITDQLSKLDILKNSLVVDFKPKMQGTPNVKLNLKKEGANYVIIDLGSNGSISLNRNKEDAPADLLCQLVGNIDSGIYGSKYDTAHFYKVPLFLGEHKLKDELVEFDNGATIGNRFLKKYILTLDWTQNKVTLSPVTPVVSSESKLLGYGFYPRFSEGKFTIASVIDGSEAMQKGVFPGDQLMSVNGQSFEKVAFEQYCRDFMEQNLLPKSPSIKLVVKKAESGDLLNLQLKRKDFSVK